MHGYAVFLQHPQQFRYFPGAASITFLADGREHLCGDAALTGEFEHVAAVCKVAKTMHCTGRHMHQGTGLTYDRLSRAGEFDSARNDIKGLVPVMAMGRRTHSLLALLPSDVGGACKPAGIGPTTPLRRAGGNWKRATTRMPGNARLISKISLKVTRNASVAAYTACCGRDGARAAPLKASSEEMLMIAPRPRATIPGITTRLGSTGTRTLTSTTWRGRSVGSCAKGM